MNIQVTPLQLPIGFCPASYQDLWNTFANNSSVQIPDALSQIIWQTTAPGDQTVSWGKLDSQGRPQGIYRFAQGAWLSPHPDVPGKTIWWFSAQPDFTSFDGGDANPVSALSGPMWQLAQDIAGNVIAARFPIAAGTFPSGTVLSAGQTGGEEQHALTVPELPSHTHPTERFSGAGAANGTLVGNNGAVNSTPTATAATGGSAAAGNPTVPHNTVPPYVVGYLLQRTTRLFYVG